MEDEYKYIGNECYIKLSSKTDLISMDGSIIVPLSVTEYKILSYFISHMNTPVYLKDLAVELWGVNYDADYKDPNSLKSHISRLRNKLDKIRPGLRNCIDTNYGLESYTLKVEMLYPEPTVPKEIAHIHVTSAAQTSTEVCSVQFSDLLNLGYTPLSIAKQLVQNDLQLYEGIPHENEGSPEQWAEYLSSFPDTFQYIINSQHQIVGNWSFCAITDKQTVELTNGSLMEASFSVDETDFIMLPGDYNGYLLNFSINPAYNNTKNFNILFDSFIKQLEEYAENGIFFKKWFVNVFRKDHSAMYKRIGFRFLCENKSYGYIYQLIPLQDNTIFSKKKGRLYCLYSEHFAEI